MPLRFAQKSVRWIAVLSLVSFGVGRAAVAQGDANRSSSLTLQIETESLRSTTAIRPESDETQSAPSLNPYRSLERFVAPGDWRTSIGVTVQARPSPHVQLSRGGSLFWGTVGLFVHSYCDSRTDASSPVMDPPAGYPTVDAARCDQCDRIGSRALGAVLGGLFASGP